MKKFSSSPRRFSSARTGLSLGRIAVLALGACAFTLTPAATGGLWAQTGSVTGTIRGVLTDPSGAVVVNAEVTAVGSDTGFTRTTRSNARGEYEVPLLPTGTYTLTVTSSGFGTYKQEGITVTLERASTADVVLHAGSTSEVTTVTADATVLNTEGFQVEGGLSARLIENAGLPSRNTFNLALLTAGLNGTRDDEFGNPTFAFGGLQRKDFMIDGIDNTQRGGPGRLGIFSPENVKEVKVISGAMDAEYGRTIGGVINMITRNGTNEIHGEGLVLQRRPALISKPSLATYKPFQEWATYSMNVNGPIIHDKLFYYISGEYEPLTGAQAVTITPANAAALGLTASDLTAAPFKQRFQSYLGRIDFQANEHNDFYARYSQYLTPSQYNTSGGLLVNSAGNNFNDHDDTASAQWSHIFSASSVNQLRGGYLRRIFDRPPVSGQVLPVVNISGVASLFSNTSANQHYEEDQYNFIDTFTKTVRNHTVKLGADIDTIHVLSVDRLTDTYTFTNLAQYLGAINGTINPATGKVYNYNTLTQAFGNNTAQHRTTPINFFAQDHWQVSSRFSLSYGLRYEYRFFPSLDQTAPLAFSRSIHSDASNLAPRLGFNMLLGQKTVLRGGFGTNYDTLNLRLISLVDRSNGSRVLTYTVSGTAAGAPQYPSGFTGPAASFAVKPSVYGFDPSFKTQYAFQSNLAVEHQLLPNTGVTIGTQLYLGRRAPVLIDTNLGTPTSYLADGRPVFSSANRPNTSYNQIFSLRSISNSTYYGGFVQVNQRFTHSFQFVTSYTLGWALNNNDSVGDSGSNVTDSTNINRDYGWSSSDQRHRFVFQGVWQPRVTAGGVAKAILDGWMVAPTATVTSAFPFSATAGSDLNGDGVTNDYPLYGSRNNFRGPIFREVNMRISRTFPIYERLHLEIMGEAENLLNSTNVACNAGGCSGAVNTVYGPSLRGTPSATFGAPTSAFHSRQIQLGGRLRF